MVERAKDLGHAAGTETVREFVAGIPRCHDSPEILNRVSAEMDARLSGT